MLRHLRSFRIGVVREGSDLQVFTHPGALVRLASWVAEAVAVLEAESGKKSRQGKDQALVLGALQHHADRRLRDIQKRRGTFDRAGFEHRPEDFDFTKFEGHSLALSRGLTG